MRRRFVSIGLMAVMVVAITLYGTTAAAIAQHERVLNSFSDIGTGGESITGGLIFDAAGNLYGTAYYGGGGSCQDGCGTVFELSSQGGVWMEKSLHVFTNDDGAHPYAGLIFDSAGNLYGTTNAGGAYNSGTVFELIPQADGGWSERLLHVFNNDGRDGTTPYGGLILDASGNLYGTATYGGAYAGGVAFELMPQTSGRWTEKILHSFNPSRNDGYYPLATLTVDVAGNLYGTTWVGGPYGGQHEGGIVFELTPAADGKWTYTVLHSFDTADGSALYGSVIFDASGNLYGTTAGGGSYGVGTVFELRATSSGKWVETTLLNFGSDGAYGRSPTAGLIFDSAGNLYGTTSTGGLHGFGVVFELTPGANGSWTETVLRNLIGSPTDGQYPQAGLIFDAAGSLYGTASEGGAYGGGVVFEIKR